MAGVAAQAHTALHPWETRRWENGEARQDADESFFERGPTLQMYPSLPREFRDLVDAVVC